jgi:hypothetical protein
MLCCMECTGDTGDARGMNGVHEEGAEGTGGEPKRRSRGERAAKKARPVGSEDSSGISAPPGLTTVLIGSSNAPSKKLERAERELYHPPVKEPAASESVVRIFAHDTYLLIDEVRKVPQAEPRCEHLSCL